MSEEDDTYSTIFTALKHPLRRRILRRLQTSPATYTELLTELSIENGLLNYHLESVKELLTKQEDGKYALNEFGRAGVQLLQRVEEPISISTKTSNQRRDLSIKILGIAIIIVLSFSTWSLYQSEQILKSEINDQQSQIQTLLKRSQAYASLLDSNITTPVSKIESVAKALSRGGWNSSSLRGMEVDASLVYVRMFSSKSAGSFGFESIGRVYKPVTSYSPRIEYNVTEPGAYPPMVGTMTYRYVWAVLIQNPGSFRTIPPPGLYFVDASTGELFEYSMVGVRLVN